MNAADGISKKVTKCSFHLRERVDIALAISVTLIPKLALEFLIVLQFQKHQIYTAAFLPADFPRSTTNRYTVSSATRRLLLHGRSQTEPQTTAYMISIILPYCTLSWISSTLGGVLPQPRLNKKPTIFLSPHRPRTLLSCVEPYLEHAGLIYVPKTRVCSLQVIESVSHVPLRRENNRFQPILRVAHLQKESTQLYRVDRRRKTARCAS